MKKTGIAMIVVCAATAIFAGIIQVPFTDDFSSNPTSNVNYDFVNPTPGNVQWTYDSGNKTLSGLRLGATAANFGFLVQPESFAGEDFVLSLNSVGYRSVNHHVRLFALTAGLNALGIDDSGYTARYNGGAIEILKANSSVTNITWSGGSATGTFDFELAGAYDASGNLALTFSMTDGSITNKVEWFEAAASVLNGDYFGFGGRVNNTTNPLVLSGFEMAIPEPATLGLFLISSAGLLAGRQLVHRL